MLELVGLQELEQEVLQVPLGQGDHDEDDDVEKEEGKLMVFSRP